MHGVCREISDKQKALTLWYFSERLDLRYGCHLTFIVSVKASKLLFGQHESQSVNTWARECRQPLGGKAELDNAPCSHCIMSRSSGSGSPTPSTVRIA